MFLINFANIFPRFASTTAFLCLVVAHLEWPDITPPSSFLLGATCRRRRSQRRIHPPAFAAPAPPAVTPVAASQWAGSSRRASRTVAAALHDARLGGVV